MHQLRVYQSIKNRSIIDYSPDFLSV